MAIGTARLSRPAMWAARRGEGNGRSQSWQAINSTMEFPQTKPHPSATVASMQSEFVPSLRSTVSSRGSGLRTIGKPTLSRHPLKLYHVVMHNGLHAAIIPLDGNARPIRFSDSALIDLIVFPANAVADFQESGLFAGHWATTSGVFGKSIFVS
jgi:hypothetical protein